MNLERFLVVLGADPVRWAARYGISPISAPCSECGAILDTDIPFAYETFRGLKAPTCSCGNKYTPYCLVKDPKYGDLFTGSR